MPEACVGTLNHGIMSKSIQVKSWRLLLCIIRLIHQQSNHRKNSRYHFSFKGASQFESAITIMIAWRVIRNAKHQVLDGTKSFPFDDKILLEINRRRVYEKSLVHVHAFTNQGPESPDLRQSLFNQEIVGLHPRLTSAISSQQLILCSNNREFHFKTLFW